MGAHHPPLFIFMKITYITDKEKAFSYWIQALCRWNPDYYREEEGINLLKEGEVLNREQINVLSKIRDIARKEGNGYEWFWKRYDGIAISDEAERAAWEEARILLVGIFDNIWEWELPLLKNWEKTLGIIEWGKYDIFLKKIGSLFAVQFPKEVGVVLLPQKVGSANGHTYPERDYILLNISGVDMDKRESVEFLILHELIHIAEYRSDSKKLIAREVTKKLLPFSLSSDCAITGAQWRHLLSETIAKGIELCAPGRNGNINTIGLGGGCYPAVVKIVQKSISNYLREEEAIDMKLVENVGIEWIRCQQDNGIVVNKPIRYLWARLLGGLLLMIPKK